MHDAGRMRLRQAFGYLLEIAQQFSQWRVFAMNLFSQGVSIDKLHRDEVSFIGGLTFFGALPQGRTTAYLINVGDVRMIKRGGSGCFLLEAAHANLVGREIGRQEFEGNFTVQPRVFGEVNFSHSAFTDLRADLVAA